VVLAGAAAFLSGLRGLRLGARVPAPSRFMEGAGVRAQSQFRRGPIRWAKELRARCNRLLTVPRFTPVMSAISS